MPDFITVVSGVPRSGTSMMMRMLGAGGLPLLTDGLRAADEHNPLGYFEDDRVKRLARDAAWFAEARGKAIKVIYRLLPYLPGTLPYRIIFLQRDLREVVRSQNAMLQARGEDIGQEDEARTVKALEQDIEKYRRATGPLLDVSYGSVLENPAAEARRIAAFLELELDIAAMAAAVDPALYRQRVV